MNLKENKNVSSPELPVRNWYERLNFLNILIIIFLFLTIFSGKNLMQDNRPADVMAGIDYFLKKFFPPDFSDFNLILLLEAPSVLSSSLTTNPLLAKLPLYHSVIAPPTPMLTS